MNESTWLGKRGAQISLWAALVFVGVVLPVVSPGPVLAGAAHAICYRCFSLILIDPSPDAWGADRSLRILCRTCTNSPERCSEGTAEVERQIAEQVKILADLAARKGDCGEDRLCLEAWEYAFDDTKRRLDALYDVLNRMKAHCRAQDIGGGLDALNPGGGPSSPGGSNVPRTAPTGGADTGRVTTGVEGLSPSTGPRSPEGTNVGRDDPTAAGDAAASPATSGTSPVRRSLAQQVRDRQVRMEPVSPARGGQSPPPVHTGSLDVVGQHLAALQRLLEPMLAAAFSLDRSEPINDLVASETANVSTPWALSDKGLAEPTLVEVDQDLPPAPVDEALVRATRLNANAVAYAEALEYTASEAAAAVEQGDAKKALELVDHALYLAALGQAEERGAEEHWVTAVRKLSEQRWWFNDHLRTSGVTAEQAFAQWQNEVRQAGLPADYARDLRGAGWTDEQVAQHRDDLLALTPASLVSRDRRFAVVAAVHSGTPTQEARPVEDGEWTLASLRLLRLREQLGGTTPEAQPDSRPE